ncbi:MAG: Flp pilus assembly protein CpaB [Bauldia sp.]|nr:Flp pilus assembly protein CpaB [Bauldia sp.]
MSIQRILILLVALGAGVGAAFLALNMSTPRETAPQQPIAAVAPPIDTVEIMVARADIPIGTPVTSGDVRWMEWPRAGLVAPYIERTDSEELIGQVTNSIARDAFYVGEPITLAKLVSTNSGFLSAILPEGKRALAIEIAADTSAGGFILPNDRVDVIMTRRTDDGAGTERFITETILHDVRVLAIDQTLSDVAPAEGAAGETRLGDTATLELTPQQAEIITVAQQMGDRLTLALRSLADAKRGASDSERDALYLIGGPSSTSNRNAITIIRNGVATEVVAAQ